MGKPRATLRSLYLFVVLAMTLGFAKIGRAAQRVRRFARSTRATLRSSYLSHLTSRAWGYFRPGWREQELAELPPPVAQREGLVDDPQGRVERTFRARADLKERVGFWLDVYSRFTTHFRIVHDRDNPSLIYGYIDLRPLYRTFPGRIADAKAYQIEQRVVKELKARIAEAMEISSPKVPTMSAEEKAAVRAMLARFGATTPERAAALLPRLRTQTGQRDVFTKALGRSRALLPQIEQAFRERGLPVALARLPFVESSFNPRAVSKTGAIGMWQFMPDTARLFDRRGTRRDWADPVKQSRSAAKLLGSLYARLPDWGIAVTAYNSGAARLDRIVKKYRADGVSDLIAIPSSRETLGFAGKNFYCELLAATIAEAYQDKLFPKGPIARRVQSLAQRNLAKPRAVPARDVSSLAADGPRARRKRAKVAPRAVSHRAKRSRPRRGSRRGA